MRTITLDQARGEVDSLRCPSAMTIDIPLNGGLDWRMNMSTRAGEEVCVTCKQLGDLTLFAGELLKPL